MVSKPVHLFKIQKGAFPVPFHACRPTFHLDGEAHIPVGRALADVLIKARLASRFPWSREFVVVDTAQRERAEWVFALRRDQIAGVAATELAARVREHR